LDFSTNNSLKKKQNKTEKDPFVTEFLCPPWPHVCHLSILPLPGTVLCQAFTPLSPPNNLVKKVTVALADEKNTGSKKLSYI
jgi:hypothetical protein